jgi:hypothetical protein
MEIGTVGAMIATGSATGAILAGLIVMCMRLPFVGDLIGLPIRHVVVGSTVRGPCSGQVARASTRGLSRAAV